MKKSLIAAALASALCLVNESKADGWSPLGLGLCAPVQFPGRTSDVYGLRLGGLYGHHVNVYGLDASLCGIQEDFVGVQAAGVTWSHGTTVGLQIALASVDTFFQGVQVSALNWDSAEAAGVQLAAVNANQSSFEGFAAGGLNASLRFAGCQLGVINTADDMEGVQVGLFNAAQRLWGVQVGFLNLVCESKPPIMVVATACF